jgi:hypothetical protein
LSKIKPANIDPASIRPPGYRDALLRVIDAIDFALSDDRSQLAHRSASSTTYVEDNVPFSD